MTRILVFFVLFSSTVFSIQAQKFTFLNYDVDDGLAHSQVRSLFQDDNGVLWIGTLSGVSRFDGQEFKNYSTNDGLVNNDVVAIGQLSDKSLIFGSKGGFAIYDGRKFTRVKFKDSWKSVSINEFVNHADSLLIATEQGLASYYNNQLTYYPTLLPEEDSNLKSITEIEDGFLLLTRNSLFKWTFSGISLVISATDAANSFQYSTTTFLDMEMDSKGRIYISTSGLGLIELYENKIDRLSIDEGLVSRVVDKLYLDDNEDIMVCSKVGLSHLKSNVIYSFTERNGLERSDVRAVLKDKEGRYWLGTNGGGLFKFTGYSFTYYTTDDGISSNAIMTINSNNNGEMYFGSFDEGISLATENGWEYLRTDAIRNNQLWTSTLDSLGQVWFGSTQGIDIIKDGIPVKNITTSDGLDFKKVTALQYDHRLNGVWAGTSRGLNFISGDSIQQFQNLKMSRVRAIEIANSGKVYFGSREGVWENVDGQFNLLDVIVSLEDKTVYCLKWHNNVLWIGTKQSGLFRYENGKAKRVFLSTNFSSNTINFLEIDPYGNLWTGTNLGIFRVTPDLNVESYTKQDGLISLETNLNAVYSDKESLWFGTSGALQRLNYAELDKLTALPPPEVVMKEVKLNLEETDWKKITSHLRPHSNIPNNPVVTHKDNHFSFKFHATSVEDASNIRYQYMLEGFDNNWQPITENASATYTNLPFQEFVFKVRAKRLSQSWGTTLEYPFCITPPFWQTWWFRITSILLLSYMAYAIFQYRRKNLITALEREKFEIKSKMLVLEQQSLNSSMNRHFIFNALNSIQYYINRQDRLSANRYLSSFAKLIRKNLDSSQVNFTSLADELERLELYLEIENMRFKDKFDYTINVTESIDEEVVKIPSMLLQPYLENSIWHGILPQDKPGKINVDIDKNELGQMEIRIKDNGIGITTSQALKNGKAAHISKGMNITSGRIELLRKITTEKVTLIGPFELTNEDGDVLGTQVTIKLPMEYNEVVVD